MMQKSMEGLWRGARKIYYIILERPSTFTELKRDTGFSNTIISRYLRDLKKNDLIYLRTVDRKYVVYEEPYRTLYHQMIHSGLLLHEVESLKPFFNSLASGTDNATLQKQAIRSYVMILAATLPATIYSSIDRGKTAHQRLDNLIELFTRPLIHAILDLCLVKKDLAELTAEEISKTLYKTGIQDYETYQANLRRLSKKIT
jgi:hypothetical protein